MSIRNPAHFQAQSCGNRRLRKGVALLVTLTAVTLVSIVLIAFLVQTRLHRTISFSSAGQARAEFLARAALDTVINDFKGEITEGSTSDTQYGVTVYRPYSAANAVPFRMITSGTTNLIRWSKNGVAAWPTVTGTTVPIPVRSGSDNTTTASANGRYIDFSRWAKPVLDSALPASFTPPDWILFTRQGAIKDATHLPSPAVLSDASPSNLDYVVGRYAYTVHDVSGLLDITVAGHKSGAVLTGSDISRGGSTILADLTQIGLTQADIDKIVAWRNAQSSASSGNYQSLIYTSTNDYTTVANGDQTFLGRQDLLNFWKQAGLSASGSSTLPYLTTFSRDLNAPSTVPAAFTGSNGYIYPQPPNTGTNVDVLQVRFSHDATLNTESDLALLEKNVQVKKGDPLIRRRFPLNRLAWVGLDGPAAGASATDVKKAFGLAWDSSNLRWVYTSPDVTGTTAATAIKNLGQVAALSSPRDPDFFELLKAGILNGSLAKVTGDPTLTTGTTGNNPYLWTGKYDSSSDLQLIQIGANIIDQSSPTGIPTAIAFDINDNGSDVTAVYGTKSLPYLCYFTQVGFRPLVSSTPPARSDFGAWLVPAFWDPHQNAITATAYDPTQFRILPIQGQLYTRYQYYPLSSSTASTTDYTATPRILTNSDAIIFKRAISNPVIMTSATNNFVNPILLRSSFVTSSASIDLQLTSATSCLVSGSAVPFTPLLQPGFVGFCSGTCTYNDPDYYISGTGGPSLDCPNATQAVYVQQSTSASGRLVLEIQCQYGAQWRTYQRWDYFRVFGSGYDVTIPANTSFHHLQSPFIDNFVWIHDPRTTRFGGQGNHKLVGTGEDFGFWDKTGFLNSAAGTMSGGPGWLPQSAMASTSNTNNVGDTSMSCNTVQSGTTTIQSGTSKQVTYQDRDAVLRPGDAAIGSTYTNSMVAPLCTNMSNTAPNLYDRPVILNRPFRSVGELGYAFRGQPWKTLDFFSAQSADAALLDLFSVSDTTVTAGRVSLNTPYPNVLASIISGALQTELALSGSTPSLISGSGALQVSGSLVSVTGTSPFVNRSDLVTLLSSTNPYISASAALGYPPQKTMREAFVRALSETTTTRTWNLMIDVIAQSGRYPAGAGNNSKFVVEGERRYWLHVAIDRYTGKIVGQKLEAVDE